MQKNKNLFIIFLIGGLISVVAAGYVYITLNGSVSQTKDCLLYEQTLCQDSQLLAQLVPLVPVAIAVGWAALLLILSAIFFYLSKKPDATSSY